MFFVVHANAMSGTTFTLDSTSLTSVNTFALEIFHYKIYLV